MTPVQVATRVPLDDYSGVVGSGEIDEMRALAKPLSGHTVQMVNSTAAGGGASQHAA